MALRVRSMLLLFAILAVFLGAWQVAATPSAASGPALDPEYAKLLGAAAQQGQQTPGATHEKLWVEPDRLLLTSKQSSTLRTYAFSQPR